MGCRFAGLERWLQPQLTKKHHHCFGSPGGSSLCAVHPAGKEAAGRAVRLVGLHDWSTATAALGQNVALSVTLGGLPQRENASAGWSRSR